MVRALATVLFLAAISVAHADETYKPPEFLRVTPPLPASLQDANVWRLDLAEALRVALRQNLEVVIERKAVRATELGVDVANGIFEPAITAAYGHNASRSPPTTSQEGGADEILRFESDAWRLGISKRFAPGTRIDLDFSNNRDESMLGTAVAPLNYRSTLSLRITQPLLRGFSTDLAIPQIDVLRARIASERERLALLATITDVIQRAEAAYWGVLQSLYRYDLAVRTEQGAKEQLALTQRQIDAGTLAPSDLIGAQSNVAQRQLDVVLAEEALQQASDQLRAVLNLPRDQWSRPILPVDVPQFVTGKLSPEAALETAIKHRPELAQLDLDIKSALLSVRQAANNKLPQIDLSLSTAVVGQDTAYGGALGQLGTIDARAWGVFVNLSWTPLQRASRAQAEIARIQHESTAVQREALVQRVWSEVRQAVRDQLGAERQVFAAARYRELAEQSLEIEQRKFLNGTSQNIDVQQRQDQVARARLAELDALLAHTRATAVVLRATGRLLPERNLALAP